MLLRLCTCLLLGILTVLVEYSSADPTCAPCQPAALAARHSRAAARSTAPIPLRVNEPRDNEMGHHQQAMLYELVGLQPASQYEVRVSYPATVPSAFDLQFHTAPSGRRLRNVEKLVFLTDEQGLVRGAAQPLVRVTPLRTGVPLVPSPPQPVPYSIVLEAMPLGVPHSSWPLIGAVLLLLPLALRWGVPMSVRAIRAAVARYPAAHSE